MAAPALRGPDRTGPRFIRHAVLPQQVTNGFDWIVKLG